MDKVFFEEIAGEKIFCYLSEPRQNNKKIVIMCHGFRGVSMGPARTFVDFARILVENGYSVLRFDQPNCGNSDGDYIDVSFNEWVDTIVYFARKYLQMRYKVILLGQSMGATAVVIATSNRELQSRIPCIILWVPDPVNRFDKPADKIYEEEGQRYKGTFWQEAKEANFFRCLRNYNGGIHLVYGEHDHYVSKEQRERVIKELRQKNQQILILKGQNHSPWEYKLAQKAYHDGLKVLKKYL